ncbi:MAG: hypothetical protein KDE53_22435 [Caldilineaceae bacterium]|nr:hypothetical protein [Caldilineaceae bacterium]MCB0123484.1 hypothetical protein [Caldilineaceae bacterium]
MSVSNQGSSGKPLQKLVDYVEEIIQRTDKGVPRGPGSVEDFVNWLQRTYRYINDEEQEFRVVVRTPDIAETQETFSEFCDTISFAGSCEPQDESDSASNYLEATDASGNDTPEFELQLEIDFEVVDAKISDSNYTVHFEFDPIIPHAVGSALIRHQLMAEGIDGSKLDLTVTSINGRFTAYVEPEFALSGTALVPKTLVTGTTVDFGDPSGIRRHYQLVLDLRGDDQYALSGSYAT